MTLGREKRELQNEARLTFPIKMAHLISEGYLNTIENRKCFYLSPFP